MFDDVVDLCSGSILSLAVDYTAEGVQVELMANPVSADYNANGQIEMSDVAELQRCASTGVDFCCEQGNLDGDLAIDGDDWALFDLAITGP